jgi:hypothetical protein
MAFAPVHPVAVLVVVLVVIATAVFPTCLYLYVEPRGRRSWGVAGDSPGTRRAPVLVRVTAWVSFAAGQLAIPWLLVPAGCAGLLYVQTKIGAVRPIGSTLTVLLGVMSLVQALLALRLVPLGVRLIARDARSWSRLATTAKVSGLSSGVLMALGVLMAWGMAAAPGLVHPWLRIVLAWAALRPVLAYAAVGLLHALLLASCARRYASPAAPTVTRPRPPGATG